MRRVRASVITAVLVGVAACSELPSGPQQPEVIAFSGQGGRITAGTCTTLGQLNTLALAVFRSASPNVNSVLGKLKALDGDVRKGKLNKAIERAHDIVDFTLKHHHAGRLPGSEAELTAFVNAVYCYAGIDVDIDEPSNSHLILPSDQVQVVYSIDGQAAIRFEANPVSEPTLIEFAQLPESPVPGDGPLDTKLDQYPGFISITKSSETNAPLTKPAVVGICASGVIPQEVRDRLRLGHGKAAGFEIAAPAAADFLTCENATEAEVAEAGLLSRLASFLSPRPLHASAARFRVGGGVGGTVTEFSPFAPVDPQLRSGGGVGGTVTEFSRSDLMRLLTDGVSPVETCTALTAPQGTKLSAICHPFVRITTRLGTSFLDVPITWAVSVGGGLVADEDAAQCGAFASVIVAPTDLFGRSAICWKLGSVGANQVTATPSVGGDAPAGVTFAPAVVTFDATATPVYLGTPTTITLIRGSGHTFTAGVLEIFPVVKVTDALGNPILGVTVHWTTVEGTGAVTRATSVTDAAGLALTGWTLGVGPNTLKASFGDPEVAFVLLTGTGTAP